MKSLYSHNGIKVSEMMDRYMVVNEDTGRWLLTNATGRDITISLLERGGDRNATAEQLAGKYALAFDYALRTVEAFAGNLGKTGILAMESAGNHSVDYEKLVKRYIHPGNITIEVTARCNLNCGHCYKKGSRPAVDMAAGLPEKIAADTAALDGPPPVIILSGGEPLLYENLFDAIRLFAERGCRTILLTNGTLLDADTAAALKLSGVDKVQVSVDGPDPATHDAIRGPGSFEKAKRGIGLLLENGIGAAASMTPNGINIREIDRTIDFVRSAGVREMNFSWITPHGNARDNWEKLRLKTEDKIWLSDHLEEKARELEGTMRLSGISCTNPAAQLNGRQNRVCALGANLRISERGEVYPCDEFHWDSDEICIGSAADSPLGNIVVNERMVELRRRVSNRIKTVEKCIACGIGGLCGGGCPAIAYAGSGSLNSTENCSMHKYRIEKHLRAKYGGGKT